MRIVAKSDKSLFREDNQDRFLSGILSCGVGFAFVRDGMGGANGGGVASSTLCKDLEERLFLENDNRNMIPEKTVVDAVDSACSDIFYSAQKNKSLTGMGTTLSGVTIKGDICNAYNIGDSRVYVLRKGVLTQITEDHSVVRQLFRKGAITREEMATSPQRHLITRAVGVTQSVETDISEFHVKPDDKILCATDGLTNALTNREIIEILSDDDFYSIADNLIKKALEKDANDNITAVVVEY